MNTNDIGQKFIISKIQLSSKLWTFMRKCLTCERGKEMVRSQDQIFTAKTFTLGVNNVSAWTVSTVHKVQLKLSHCQLQSAKNILTARIFSPEQVRNDLVSVGVILFLPISFHVKKRRTSFEKTRQKYLKKLSSISAEQESPRSHQNRRSWRWFEASSACLLKTVYWLEAPSYHSIELFQTKIEKFVHQRQAPECDTSNAEIMFSLFNKAEN